MKKLLFLSMLAAITVFTSCSKSDDVSQNASGQILNATFSVQAPTTRAAVSGLTRYIVEAYEGKDLTTTPQRVESASGSLTVSLEKNTEYTFVFWADFGTANTKAATSGDYYNADDLKTVKVNPTAYATTVATPAYYVTTAFNSDDFEANKAVVLGNATAQLNFVETAGLLTAANSLSVTYSSGGIFNATTGTITELGNPITRTYTGIAQIAKDGTLVTDYLLASAADKRLLNLKVQLNSETPKDISNVPLQCSYKTNIKGEFTNLYSSAFTISSEVENYTDQEKPLVDETKTITIDGVAFDFVLVKAGTFQMGTPGASDKETPCWVKITQDYYIGTTEVTQEQYQKIMSTNPSNFQGNDNPPAAGETQVKRPVEKVSWDAICTGENSFLAKMNALPEVSAAGTVRLPSEAQWEYAARGGHKAGAFMKWPGTNTDSEVVNYAWYYENSDGKTHEVGKKSPNILGLFDMAGNVREWCSSYYSENYPTTPDPLVDPDETTTGTKRVQRGGDFDSDYASYVTSAWRSYNTQSSVVLYIGFRLVLVPR